MSLLKGAFCIAFVALLIPHEPNLGAGRLDAFAAFLQAETAEAARERVLDRLTQVKADIAASRGRTATALALNVHR